jgi:UDP-glucuronate 4-epimerase
MSAMRVLVTGCAGFIASRVIALLVSGGHDVVGVDNMNDAYDARLKERRLGALLEAQGLTYVHMDITDRDGIADLFSGHRFDAVINLAARAGVRQSLENPWVYLETNSTGNLNLLDQCRATGVPKFVLASTSSLYGNTERPFREDAQTDSPISPYAASKKAAEVMCYTYHVMYGLDVSVLRFFTVYGPAGRPDMSVFRFTKWIREGLPLGLNGDGSQERDFTYVDDIAAGVVSALAPLGYEIINLGNDQPATLLHVISTIEEALGRKANIEHHPMHPADVKATWADISKAKRLLGWAPSTSVEQGLRNAVNWYEENRDWAKDISLE